ncbi:hypothetical protein [Sulfurisphaera javensis]
MFEIKVDMYYICVSAYSKSFPSYHENNETSVSTPVNITVYFYTFT